MPVYNVSITSSFLLYDTLHIFWLFNELNLYPFQHNKIIQYSTIYVFKNNRIFKNILKL